MLNSPIVGTRVAIAELALCLSLERAKHVHLAVRDPVEQSNVLGEPVGGDGLFCSGG